MSVFPGFGGWINQNIQQRPEVSFIPSIFKEPESYKLFLLL